MDKIFGEIDYVEAAENELELAKEEETIIGQAVVEGPFEIGGEKREVRERKGLGTTAHVEDIGGEQEQEQGV